MKKEALISVIVPIYQIDKYLGICIESLLKQTYRNLEIILVDDGSTDRCAEICDLYAKKDNRIKVIHKPNGGLVSARKAGLEASLGEYIGYVDGDDWVGPGYYESLYTSIVTSGADIVCAGQTRDLFAKSVSFLNYIPIGLYCGEELEKLKASMLSYGDFYRTGISTYVWNKLFKRSILYDNQMQVDNRISIGEDAAVTYPAIMKCESVYVTDCVAYHYRQREDSMLKKSAEFKEEIEKLRYLYEYLNSALAKYPEHYKLKEQIIDYVLGICFMRSGGQLPQNQKFSAFGDLSSGKKIVIYSAGTFGQQLMNRIKENDRYEVVGWIDEDFWEYRRCCLDVDSIEALSDMEYDYIFIATVDCKIAQRITQELFDYGVSANKIKYVICPENVREDLIDKYLY